MYPKKVVIKNGCARHVAEPFRRTWRKGSAPKLEAAVAEKGAFDCPAHMLAQGGVDK